MSDPISQSNGHDGGHSSTSLTLLHSLRECPGDESSWFRFVERYGPLVHKWCINWGLQPEDSADVSQDVMLRISKAMQSFQYDPSGSFRAWLKTVTHHAWRDWVRREYRHSNEGALVVSSMSLESVEAGDDLVDRLQKEFDGELMERAVLKVRIRLAPQTWQAFEMTAIQGVPGAEVAKGLGMQTANVYVAKRKVMLMLKDEMNMLDPPAS